MQLQRLYIMQTFFFALRCAFNARRTLKMSPCPSQRSMTFTTKTAVKIHKFHKFLFVSQSNNHIYIPREPYIENLQRPMRPLVSKNYIGEQHGGR